MGKHKSIYQNEVILGFMKSNPDLARGFSKGDKVTSEVKWAELCSALNDIGSPTKDVGGWKKIWCDWKATIRKKLAENKAEIRATGGGPYFQLAIGEVEEEVAKLCGFYEMVDGVDGPAYGVPPTMKHEVDQGSEEETEEPADAPFILNTDKEPKPKRRRPNPAASLDLQSMCETQLNIISQLNSSMTEHFKNMEEVHKESIAVQKEDIEVKKELLNKFNDILSKLKK